MRYIVFHITNKGTTIRIEYTGGAEQTYGDFIKKMPAGQPRYGVVDFEFMTPDNRPQSKILFLFWSPDEGASLKDKMLYASSKDAIRKQLDGVAVEVQANEASALTVE